MPEFKIEDGNWTNEVAGRANAVDTAKARSRRTWRPVRVTRADGAVRMQFRRGALSRYERDVGRRR